jgi:hypothetical protein
MVMTCRSDGEARHKRRVMIGKSVFKRLRGTSEKGLEVISNICHRKVGHGEWHFDEAGSCSYPYCVDLSEFTVRG